MYVSWFHVGMKSLYSPGESNECIVKSFSPRRQTSLSSTIATPSLCSPDNQPAAQVQVRSNKGVSIPLLHIPIAPRQIAAKPNQISGEIDTAHTSTVLLSQKPFCIHVWTVFLPDIWDSDGSKAVHFGILGCTPYGLVGRYERFGAT